MSFVSLHLVNFKVVNIYNLFHFNTLHSVQYLNKTIIMVIRTWSHICLLWNAFLNFLMRSCKREVTPTWQRTCRKF